MSYQLATSTTFATGESFIISGEILFVMKTNEKETRIAQYRNKNETVYNVECITGNSTGVMSHSQIVTCLEMKGDAMRVDIGC